ncbi:MerR family transcriptional regulator [Nocardioides marmoriginsengisoli]|uniref:MerR family transcriptional regulator n=1 Tax=Nocardioides marmoriginsengisoli TaxID=661483 RepID=A0A3N0CB49_9ACTN|nr:MerR family transcriptional regulator [Nocardioides marmoriginsengisoli]RNL60539.1 MerR family transcriptional regulator [Nocardioides marmoriginsengisoli]
MAAPSLNIPAIETVLESLRRGQRQLARNPRAAVDAAVRQLLSLGRVREERPARETYRIDDLARASNVTVRNIRAYQERGLLHPPRREGRVAIFDDSHLSRLKIITSMLERGYTSGHITEMLTAWESGRDLADVLGLESALVPPRLEDAPVTMTLAQVRELTLDKESLQLYIDAGLIEVKGAKALVRRPELLRSFAEMRGFGMPTTALIKLHSEVAMAVDDISRALVNEAVRQVGDRFLNVTDPSVAEVGELVATLTRFRELAMGAVVGTLGESLERTIEDLLAGYLSLAVTPAEDDQVG